MGVRWLAVAAMTTAALAQCGSELSSELKISYREMSTRAAANRIQSSSNQTAIEVDTYIHVIHNGTTKDEGYLSSEQLDKQMAVLNEVFGRHSIQFNLLETEYIENEKWAHGDPDGRLEMQTLRKGSYGDLNLYFLKSMGGQVTGECTFPLEYATFPDPNAILERDGCLTVSSTVNGGSDPAKHDGLTAVHEVGHWFGLQHVFTDECGGEGDGIDDTPQQATESYGCPVGKDSCPGLPGLDSIHNYMDYSDDDCQTEFTPDQVAWMHDMWETYRAPYA